MNSFEQIAWKNVNKSGTLGKESKIHLMQTGAEKTLCGTVIPTDEEQAQISQEYSNGECKRCAKAAEKTASKVEVKAETATVNTTVKVNVVKYAFQDWLAQLTKNDMLPRGKFFQGKKVGA